jgi:ubiquinone/menaquinone biosynthesis C-methylase UbiE
VQRFFERVVAAFANMVLHHAECTGHMFREMARIVKPGSVISIVNEVKRVSVQSLHKGLEATPCTRSKRSEH